MSPSLSASPLLAWLRILPTRIDAWRQRWHGLEFAVQGMLATALAFYTAIIFDIRTPYSAAVTVWVVASTRPGHVLSKSAYRLLGTMLGGAFGVFLIATMDAMPVLLFGLLSLWVGICTGIGNLFRHFRAYAGLLAGYTAAFVVVGAQAHHDQVMLVALDRTASIMIGVLSMSLVAALSGSRRSASQMEESLQQIHARILAAVPFRWDMKPEEILSSRLRLSREYSRTEALLEYAHLETPEFHHRVRRLRVLTGLTLDLLDASRVVTHQWQQLSGSPALHDRIRDFFTELCSILAPAFQTPDRPNLQQASAGLEELLARTEDRIAISEDEHAARVILPVIHLLQPWIKQLSPEALDRTNLRDPIQPDFRNALRHALRTTLALATACTFWAISAWQEGAGFVMQCAAVCALASTMEHPAKGVIAMTWSMLAAIVAGFICKFLLLPHARDLFTMLLCFAAVLIPLASLTASRRPTLAIIGGTAGVFIFAMVQPVNHMSYDAAHYLSSSIGAVFGTMISLPVFSLILPTRPGKEGGRLLRRLSRSARKVTSGIFTPSLHAWRMTAHDQLRQMQANPETTTDELQGGLIQLDLGTHLLALRKLARDLPSPAPVLTAIATGRINEEAIAHSLHDILRDDAIQPSLRFTVAALLDEVRRLLAAQTPARKFP
ncbi:FUSC family protein [Luteolibacter luteus]|uniref:FUSC family protein n=1 Tax=Luteolibacter luteus TaxID=2728835 RepID=A0A858RQF5_9BACT|nr:FUSC family protein [Luteolibacter luteus]QJE98618.1 FUSC family protein [Luteolibacter luteus]